jgi:hypothetical protein
VATVAEARTQNRKQSSEKATAETRGMSIGSESSPHMLSLTSPAGKPHAPSRAREEETLKAILQVRPTDSFIRNIVSRSEPRRCGDLPIGKVDPWGERERREGGMFKFQLLCCRGVLAQSVRLRPYTGTTLVETGLGERRLALGPVAVSSSVGRVGQGV